MELYDLTIHELKEKLENKEINVNEILDSFYQRIDNVEDKVKAYVTITEEEARKRAVKELTGKLAGIPLAIKDNILTKGIRTTCSSKMLDNYIPPYNATVINKLNQEGVIILGKTNLDEFAMGSSTENSAFFITRNPWNLGHVSGGSSGGSAAAVAAGEAAAALGSDTGGSIRQPAAYCGVVGLKPTYGNISRYGMVAFASSFDQIGPITKDVEDAALMMNVIAGYDPRDSTSKKNDLPDYTDFLKEDVSELKIGLPKEYFAIGCSSEVVNSVKSAVKKLENAGANVEKISLSSALYALAVYYIIAPAEASSNLARYDGVRYGLRSKNSANISEMFKNSKNEGFGDEVKKRIIFGTYVLSSTNYEKYYLKAQRLRTLIKEEFARLFNDYDLIISPTTPTTAFKLGSISDPLELCQKDVFTTAVNLAGIPAISIPCGFDSNKLPIGLQIIGSYFAESKIIQTAYSLEKILNIKDKRPELEVSK